MTLTPFFQIILMLLSFLSSGDMDTDCSDKGKILITVLDELHEIVLPLSPRFDHLTVDSILIYQKYSDYNDSVKRMINNDHNFSDISISFTPSDINPTELECIQKNTSKYIRITDCLKCISSIKLIQLSPPVIKDDWAYIELHIIEKKNARHEAGHLVQLNKEGGKWSVIKYIPLDNG